MGVVGCDQRGVKLAVLVKIEEGEVPGKTIEQLEGIGEFGDNNNSGGGGDDNDDEEEEEEEEGSHSCSDPEDYYLRMDDMEKDADKWIGKYTVFMETWVYEPTTEGISVKQPRQYLMIKNVPTSPMPTLTFTRSTFDLPNLPDQDDNEQFCIDLTQYVKNLLHSRVQDAFRRKTQWISRRKEKRRHAKGDDARDCDFVESVAGRTRARAQEWVRDRQIIDRENSDADTGEGAGGKVNARMVKRPQEGSTLVGWCERGEPGIYFCDHEMKVLLST
ncbi:hypothetical protein BGX38DRAFT_893794 [Terfezia claveryi]|nr:hypothetical protein BGX38DRAFT_893794 [Terfezia claveryi]